MRMIDTCRRTQTHTDTSWYLTEVGRPIKGGGARGTNCLRFGEAGTRSLPFNVVVDCSGNAAAAAAGWASNEGKDTVGVGESLAARTAVAPGPTTADAPTRGAERVLLTLTAGNTPVVVVAIAVAVVDTTLPCCVKYLAIVSDCKKNEPGENVPSVFSTSIRNDGERPSSQGDE
jgi:hypothetical protein